LKGEKEKEGKEGKKKPPKKSPLTKVKKEDVLGKGTEKSWGKGGSFGWRVKKGHGPERKIPHHAMLPSEGAIGNATRTHTSTRIEEKSKGRAQSQAKGVGGTEFHNQIREKKKAWNNPERKNAPVKP